MSIENTIHALKLYIIQAEVLLLVCGEARNKTGTAASAEFVKFGKMITDTENIVHEMQSVAFSLILELAELERSSPSKH